MNVNLIGARSQARLGWDDMERRNKKAQDLPRRVFLLAVVAFALYLAWNQFVV